MERTAIAGCHDQLAYYRRATHDEKQQDHLRPAPSHAANHIDPAYNAMTRLA